MGFGVFEKGGIRGFIVLQGMRLRCKGVLGGTWRVRGLSKWVISRVINTLDGVTLIISLLITCLLSPLGLQVGWAQKGGEKAVWVLGLGFWGLRFRA